MRPGRISIYRYIRDLIMNKTAIITASQNAFHQLSEKGNAISESDFFKSSDGKWSVAENFRHLVLSTSTSTLAFQLPRILLRWVGGTPNRSSRTYEELLAKYKQKLDNGGKASARYVPKNLPGSQSGSQAEKDGLKRAILYKWNRVSANFIFALNTRRTEEDLDHYLVRHPLLGRITLRELGYFTIFHTLHHLESIKKISTKI